MFGNTASNFDLTDISKDIFRRNEIDQVLLIQAKR